MRVSMGEESDALGKLYLTFKWFVIDSVYKWSYLSHEAKKFLLLYENSMSLLFWILKNFEN